MSAASRSAVAGALFAAEKGIPVVPLYGLRRHADGRLVCRCAGGGTCAQPGKHPCVDGWQELATTDPDAIPRMFETWPDTGVGARVGRLDDEWRLISLDVDGVRADGRDAGGRASLRRLVEEIGRLPATLTDIRGDSAHPFLLAPASVRLRGRIEGYPGLEIKGGGEPMAVVIPPTLHASGERRRWHDEAAAIAHAPERLLELLAKPPGAPGGIREGDPEDTAYGLAALASACEAIRDAQPGERNEVLNREAYGIGGLVGGGELLEETARQALEQAVEEMLTATGGNRRKALRTLGDSFADGVKEPRVAPETDGRPSTSGVHVTTDGDTVGPTSVEIVSLDAFLAEREELPRALVGTSTDAFLPAGGLVIVGGLGGSTKTTFSVDAVAHFASGAAWCDLELGAPLRVLFIENEGPRAFFREKLRAKVEAWAGAPFAGNVFVLRGPWGRFDFRNEEHREALREAIADNEIDLVVADPLTSLGMSGAGSLEDTGAFVDLLRRCGLNDPERPVAFWLLHHLNKSGTKNALQALSGAWDNWADTIIVLRSEPAKRLTIAEWAKVRYGSLPYGEPRTTFLWSDGYGYTRTEPAKIDPEAELEDAIAWVIEYVAARPGQSRSEVEDAYRQSRDGRKRVRAREAIRACLDNESAFRTLADKDDPEAEARRPLPRLARGPGKAANGIYLYPASEASSPLFEGVDGEHGELGEQPVRKGLEGQLAALAELPLGSEAASGEHDPSGEDSDA